MSWENELYSVYETQCGREFDGEEGLQKISHSTANAQIQITLDENGEFNGAKTLSKEEGKNTPILVTEDSANRTSGDAAMPFADNLQYIAADYPKYTDGKGSDNSEKFSLYIKQLKKWSESEYTHPAVNALYNYISKGNVIADLVRCGVLSIDETTGKLDDSKIATIEQKKCFVRFLINGIDNPETWKNDALSEKFIGYYNTTLGEPVLCYALGKVLPPAEKHPSKIRNSGDKAKIISTNDMQNFTYRGRFSDDKEAFSVSYEFSQKMHSALKWLIARQGIHFDSLTSIIWSSTMDNIPDVYCKGIPDQDEEYDESEDPFGNSESDIDVQKEYSDLLKKRIFGDKSEMSFKSKVMIMCLDSATTGRLSVSLYDELEGSQFYENLLKWHEDIKAFRGYGKYRKLNSFSAYEITNYAYGTENSKGFIECKADFRRDLILRLLPCITQGRRLPMDIVRAICKKVSNPLAYDEKYKNHRKVLETACGLIRKNNIDRKEGVISMSYDPNETDRSYLYGCLLAVADIAERSTYEKSESDRVTNARRYWSAFAQRPWTTWKIIEGKLRPYLDKSNEYGRRTGLRYEKMLNEIMDKFSIKEFEDDSALNPNYLLGYHHFSAEIYKPSTKKTEEE